MKTLARSALNPLLALTLALLLLCAPSFAQHSNLEQQATLPTPHPLITQTIDEAQLTVLRGNTHPLARPEFDLGTAPATLPMQRMLLVLKRSPQQEASLEKLLDDQQDKSSPNYHKWLTPEDYGKQFGPTDADIQTITVWLQSHGFQVGSTKGRTVLEFSGSAGQVQEAFHTTIHKYIVNENEEEHWANSSDPQIPSALASAVAGMASLNNFPRKPMNRPVGKFTRDKTTGRIQPVTPLFTYQPSFQCSADNYCFALGPYDFATIYNVLPLWNTNVNGTGQTIAIVGESNINPQDVADFRSLFGLPANSTANGNPLNVILNGPDPGLQPDESEADIDVSWSGAIAPYATIDFVVSQSTETTSGTDLSAVYIVDNNLAGVMSESYGSCELSLGTAGNQFYNTLWQQAAAQGITVFIAAGDNGSAGCDAFGVQSPAPAQFGLAVSGYASTPYNVAVGGTDFSEFTDPEKYWSVTNNSTTQASALGYIPETTWNDSCTNAIWETISGLSQSPQVNCNNSQLNDDVPNGGSGGASNCTTPTGSAPANCAGGYAKPSWQTGIGVPNDRMRDLPDVSLFASNGFAGSFYLICQSDQTGGACNLSNQEFLGFGGTSVSSPAFAGIMALVNQQTGSRQGNANYVFYKLAAKDSLSTCNASSSPASSCIFNDVTSGTNAMPCATGSPNCTTTIGGDPYGILTGYNAATGYDQATGLGSVNASNLVTQWSSVTSQPSTTTLNSLTPTTITHGQPVNFSVTVKPQSGSGTPTGAISLVASNSEQTIAAFSLSNGTPSGSTEMLPGGTYQVTAHYPGDANYAASDSSSVSVTVNRENSQQDIFLVTFDGNGRLVNGHTNTAEYGNQYLLRVNVEDAAGQLCSSFSANPTACPSGTVNLTSNGSPLNPGTYTLNGFGYIEDSKVQLPGGTDSVTAAYSGDSSFNTSTVTAPITITQAPTQAAVTGITGAVTGQSATISAIVVPYTLYGVAPSGTITFYANGSPLSGTVAYTSGGGSPPILNATLQYAFTASGNYAITASYSGDTNYSSASAAAQNITVLYPAPSVVLNPYSQTVNYGGTASIAALIDTTNKSTYPTGTVTFRDGGQFGPILANATCTNAKDSSGNFACQVVGNFTVTSGDSIFVNYNGDANYPSSNTWAYINMPDFQISNAGVQLTAGQSQNLTITFTSVNGLGGTVSNLACSALPAETTCTFSPSQVTLPSNGTATTTLTITTTALGQSGNREFIDMGTIDWRATGAMILLGACFTGLLFSRRRAGRIAAAFMLIGFLVTLPSCGSGSGGGGGGGGGNQLPAITSLSPTKVAAGSQIQLLYVNGTNFLSTSTATYNGTLHNSSLQNPTQIEIALGPGDVAATGSYPVVVTNPSPGGGSSAPMNFSVVTGTPTGYFTPNMNATLGPITHSAQLSMQIQ